MKKIILSWLVIGLLAPQFALAAWWNPFTWSVFIKPKPATQTQGIKIVPVLDTAATTISTSSEVGSSTQAKEQKVIQKPKTTKVPSVVTDKNKITSNFSSVPSSATSSVPATPEQMKKIAAFCVLNEKSKELCAGSDLVNKYVSDSNFRKVVDQVLVQSEKNQAENQQKIIDQYVPAYVPSYRAEPITLPNYSQDFYDQLEKDEQIQDQDRFNKEICNKTGGMYVGGRCI